MVDDQKQEEKATKTAKTLRYRFIGDHAGDLANGRPLEPGEFLDLTAEDVRDPHNESLIYDGILIGTDEASEHEVVLAKRRMDNKVNGEES